MPLEITSASGKGAIFGMGDWTDDDLIPNLASPQPGSASVVNDWFWGGGPPPVTVIPWTWLRASFELRTDQPINYATISRTNGATAVSSNTTSQTTYGQFSASGSLDTFSPDDAGNLATFLTTYYANPLLRAPVLTMSLVHRVTEERWRILGREIGDRITLGPSTVQDYPGHTTVLPVPAGLPAAVQSFVITGIRHTSSVDDRVVEWTTSPLLGVTRGLLLPGAAGANATTPDNAALQIVGDIDLRADLTMGNWADGTFKTVVGKWNQDGVNQRGYLLQVTDTGLVRLVWSNDGTAVLTAPSTVAVPVNAGRLAIRGTLDVDNGAGGRTITCYTAPTIAGPWIQLGAPVVQVGVTSIFNSNAAGQISGHSLSIPSTADTVPYTVHAAEIRNGVDGTTVAAPNFFAQAPGTTSFVDALGRTWTINGGARIAPLMSGPWFGLGSSVLGGTDALPF